LFTVSLRVNGAIENRTKESNIEECDENGCALEGV